MMETLTSRHQEVMTQLTIAGQVGMTYDELVESLPDVTPFTLAGLIAELMDKCMLTAYYSVRDPAGNHVANFDKAADIPKYLTDACDMQFAIHPVEHVSVYFRRVT